MINIDSTTLKQITDLFNKRKSAIGLSKYSVGDLLDHGGMSNVYNLTTRQGKTDYVLRISKEHRSPYSQDIFNVRELSILEELKRKNQPHVVQYLDAFVADIPGQPRYYCSVMKVLSPLSRYRNSGDYIEIAVRLGSDLLPLLQSLLDKDILHRDIKPENIFYDRDFRNAEGFLLGDFGIAKINTETSVTPTGTESTMSPEIRGLDRNLRHNKMSSDMYSLGMVMYYYLNEGVYPSNRERIDKVPPDRRPFPAPRHGSKRLKQLIVKATAYDPQDRFESPQDMLRELQQCDEYTQYLERDEADSGETITVSCGSIDEMARLQAENEELRRRFEQQNQFSDQYSVPAFITPENNSAQSSTVRSGRKQKTVIIASAAVLLVSALLVLGIWIGTGSGKDTKTGSDAAVQTRGTTITQQPDDVSTKPNKLVRFSIEATGQGLEYQWYYKKKDAPSWSLWRIYTTAIIEPPANHTWDGMQVRCCVTDSEGNSVYSRPASIQLIPFEPDDFQITKQPRSITLDRSETGKKTVQFSVKANGKKMRYQWYFCQSGRTSWRLWEKHTAASFKAVPDESWDGMLIYCKITNYDGEELYSDIASVTMTDPSDSND